jgi:hypothetical protein
LRPHRYDTSSDDPKYSTDEEKQYSPFPAASSDDEGPKKKNKRLIKKPGPLRTKLRNPAIQSTIHSQDSDKNYRDYNTISATKFQNASELSNIAL